MRWNMTDEDIDIFLIGSRSSLISFQRQPLNLHVCSLLPMKRLQPQAYRFMRKKVSASEEPGAAFVLEHDGLGRGEDDQADAVEPGAGDVDVGQHAGGVRFVDDLHAEGPEAGLISRHRTLVVLNKLHVAFAEVGQILWLTLLQLLRLGAQTCSWEAWRQALFQSQIRKAIVEACEAET
jgi:hypothetical protein